MKQRQNKKNKYGWDRRRVLVAVVAGAMVLLLLVPIVVQGFLQMI